MANNPRDSYPGRGVTLAIPSLAMMAMGVAPEMKGTSGLNKDHYQPGYIVLRNPERRVRDSPETRAVQEGAQAFYCQAQLDPAEPDGPESMAVVGADVLGNESQPLVAQATVHAAQGQPISGGYATARDQAPVVHVATSTPAPADPVVTVDPNQEVNHSYGVHMQSVSGFSDVRMNIPSNGHLRMLPESIVQFPPTYQDFGNTQDEQQSEHEQVRSEIPDGVVYEESERTTRPHRPILKTPESHMSASSPYVTAVQQPHRVTSAQTVQFNDTGQLRHPEYRDQQARKRSFSNWPQGLRPTPQKLAEAGLFYTGKGDQCRCFQCGETLRKWRPDDDPLEEHALWSPNCPFVRIIKANLCKNTKEAHEEAAVQHRMQDLFVKDLVPEKVLIVEAMGFEREEIMKVLQKFGSDVSVDVVVEILLTKKNQSDASCNRHDHPPHMDPNICAVCRKNPISVTQLECRHIVCKKCFFKGLDGMYRCGVCKREVTGTVAYDSAAFNS